jgi:hypothetical protein
MLLEEHTKLKELDMISSQGLVLVNLLTIGLKLKMLVHLLLPVHSSEKKVSLLVAHQDQSFTQPCSSLKQKDGKMTKPRELYVSFLTASEIT